MYRILAIVVIVAEPRGPSPSSTFPAAPAIDVEGESVEEAAPVARPVAKVLSFPRQRALRLVGGSR